MQAMSAAGAPFEAILIAVRALEEKEAEIAARDAEAAEKRAKDAARKRNARSGGGLSEDDPRIVRGQSSDVSGDIPAEPLALSPNENNSNPHTHTPEGVTPRARKAAWPCPDGVDPQHWADLMANRKAKKLAATKTAYDGQLKKLAELSDEEWPPGRLVQHAAEHGWAAIHDPRTPKDHRNDRSPHSRQDHRFRPGPRHVDGFSAALREVADRAP
jgi:hypothetical protein